MLVHSSLVAVVHAGDHAVTRNLEVDQIVGGGHQIALLIQNLHQDVRQVLTVCSDDLPVWRQADLGRLAGGADHIGGDLVALGVVGHGLQLAGLIRHHPLQINVAVLLLIGPSVLGLELVKDLFAQRFPVEEELHCGGIGIGLYPDTALAVLDVVSGVSLPVPVGHQVDHGVVLHAGPDTLIHIKCILGDAGGIHRAEVRALGRPGAVGAGLADVVKAGPHKLAQNPFPVPVHLPGMLHGGAPAHRAAVIIAAADVKGIVILIIAPAAHGGRGLAAHDDPVGVLLIMGLIVGGIVTAFTVVEAGDVTDVGHLLHVVIAKASDEVIIALGGGSGGIHFLDPAIELGGSLHRGSHDFVTQRPHDDTGVILSPLHHVFDVELRPSLARRGVRMGGSLAEETVVVIGPLSVLPTVEGLVDDHQTQPVADLQQLVRGRIVGHADSVDSHFLHGLHLPLDGPVVGYCAQRALVVVHTHAVELHIFTI